MYLSLLTLRQTPSTKALAQLLNPEHEGRRMDAHHRLVWTAFAGDPSAERDYLWRQENDSRFFVLSNKPPVEAELFECPRVQEFRPDLRHGDKLAFRIRLNPTRTMKTGEVRQDGKMQRKHRDIVMHALKEVPVGERARVRMTLANTVTNEWLSGLGTRAGFELLTSTVTGYRTIHLPGPRHRSPQFGVVDADGTLMVSDPTTFLGRLKHGFGRAKAFGCGLMLIRKA